MDLPREHRECHIGQLAVCNEGTNPVCKPGFKGQQRARQAFSLGTKHKPWKHSQSELAILLKIVRSEMQVFAMILRLNIQQQRQGANAQHLCALSRSLLSSFHLQQGGKHWHIEDLQS